MNLLKIQDALKNASDDQLMQLMQAPDSTAPSYLVLSEIRRRKDMRSKQEPGPESTVAEDLTAPPQTYADQDGIRSLRQPGYEEEARAAAGDGAGIEAMRAGGVVRMENGGGVDEPSRDQVDAFYPAVQPERPLRPGARVEPDPGIGSLRPSGRFQSQMPSYRESFQDIAGLFPDNSARIREQMRELRVDPAARKNEAMNLALIEAGLRIAASKNPSLIGSIGEGAVPAVQSYGQQLGQIRAEQRAGLRDEMMLAKSEIERMYAIGQINASERRTMMQEIGADRRAATALAAQAQQNASRERSEQTRLERLERGEGLRFDRERQLLQLRGQQERDLEALRAGNRPADVSGAATRSATIGRSITELDKQIEALGSRPSEFSSLYDRARRNRNPRLDEWTTQNEALQARRRELLNAQRQYDDIVLYGRPRGGAGAGAGAGASGAATPPVIGSYSTQGGYTPAPTE